MSASSTVPCTDEQYSRLATIISPTWSKHAPAVLEVSLLPSSSHPDIQHDPLSNPPAVGIPKSVGLDCFLRARSIIFSLKHRDMQHYFDHLCPDPSANNEWVQLLDATAVILVWEPNHVTAINWRRQALVQLLRCCPAPEQLEIGERARCAERIFLNSLLTSPMSQHAKSSTLWAYRLQLLRASGECCKSFDKLDPSRNWLSVEEVWREEVGIIPS